MLWIEITTKNCQTMKKLSSLKTLQLKRSLEYVRGKHFVKDFRMEKISSASICIIFNDKSFKPVFDMRIQFFNAFTFIFD